MDTEDVSTFGLLWTTWLRIPSFFTQMVEKVTENRKLRLFWIQILSPAISWIIISCWSSWQPMMLAHFYTYEEEIKWVICTGSYSQSKHILCPRGESCVYLMQQNSEHWLLAGVGAELHSHLHKICTKLWWENSLTTHIALIPGAVFKHLWRRIFWQNVVHWKREWQTTSVFLPWEPHEQYEKAKW